MRSRDVAGPMPATGRVSGPLGGVACAALARVRSDRAEGARELALEALDGLDAELRGWAHAPAQAQHRAARTIVRALARTQPAMGLFADWSEEWAEMVRRAGTRRLSPRGRGWVRRWRAQLREEPARIAAVVRRALPPGARIVTLSRGTTLASALRSLSHRNRPREIVVLESRPGGEGRRLAAELREAGLRARWVRDGSLSRELSAGDLVLVGADTIERNGSVVHKIGTRAVALLAGRRGVPFDVVAGRSKWLRGRGRSRPLPRLFDRTPARLITAYWTDAGVIRGGRQPVDSPPGKEKRSARLVTPRKGKRRARAGALE